MQIKKSAAIDILRASSVLYIVGFWHLLNYTSAFPGYANAVTYRITVVILGLFVFLSGYLLASKEMPASLSGVAAFYRNRLLRIWPLYALALLAFVAYGIASVKTALLASVGVGMIYGGPPLTLWFVTSLLVFYLVAPALILSARTPIVFLGITVTLFLLARHYQIDARLALYFPSFVLGVLVARNRQAVDRIPLALIAIASVIALAISASSGFPEKATESIGIAAIVPLFCLRLGERLYTAPEAPKLLRAISYAGFAMYLFHRPIYATLVTLQPNNPELQMLYLVGVCLPVVTVASYAIQSGYDAIVGRLTPGRSAVVPGKQIAHAICTAHTVTFRD